MKVAHYSSHGLPLVLLLQIARNMYQYPPGQPYRPVTTLAPNMTMGPRPGVYQQPPNPQYFQPMPTNLSVNTNYQPPFPQKSPNAMGQINTHAQNSLPPRSNPSPYQASSGIPPPVNQPPLQNPSPVLQNPGPQKVAEMPMKAKYVIRPSPNNANVMKLVTSQPGPPAHISGLPSASHNSHSNSQMHTPTAYAPQAVRKAYLLDSFNENYIRNSVAGTIGIQHMSKEAADMMARNLTNSLKSLLTTAKKVSRHCHATKLTCANLQTALDRHHPSQKKHLGGFRQNLDSKSAQPSFRNIIPSGGVSGVKSVHVLEDQQVDLGEYLSESERKVKFPLDVTLRVGSVKQHNNKKIRVNTKSEDLKMCKHQAMFPHLEISSRAGDFCCDLSTFLGKFFTAILRFYNVCLKSED